MKFIGNQRKHNLQSHDQNKIENDQAIMANEFHRFFPSFKKKIKNKQKKNSNFNSYQKVYEKS